MDDRSTRSTIVSEEAVRARYEMITKALISRGCTITTMESCTSGQIASLITDTEGASAVLKGAFITYSNESKIRCGVSADIIDEYGVYSTRTAYAMADACRKAYDADIGIGITGSFANADPANADSVPGEVFFAIATREGTQTFHCTVPPRPSRYAYKLYMAGCVADELIRLLDIL